VPAVQGARETARRVNCGNNLHQIGVAMHGFHSARGHFPQGGVEVRALKNSKGKPLYPNGRQLAWSAYILPFLNQKPLFDQIDFGKAFDSPENTAAARQIVSTYICPSVARLTCLRSGLGACDYGGIYGERIFTGNDPPRGVMLFQRPVSVSDIRDGTSRTLMTSEDCSFDEMQWINGQNVFDVSAAINTARETDIHSYHRNGANGLMADGSVRFLHDKMDLETLAAICTRAGGENVGEF
jgi:prepilin-type processing-associated H-X9-DG protein